MALTDDQKLEITLRAFKKRLNQIDTWADFKTIMANITKAKIITFIKNEIQAEVDKKVAEATELNAESGALQQEIDTI